MSILRRPCSHAWVLPLLFGTGWTFGAPEPAEAPPRTDASETREAAPADGALPGIPAVRFLGTPAPDRAAVGGVGCAAGPPAASSLSATLPGAPTFGPAWGPDAGVLLPSNPARAPPLLG